jgi:hypothetical protein
MKLKELSNLDLDHLVSTLRLYGITQYSHDGVHITVGPSLSPVEHISTPFEDEQEQLPCGHSIWESNDEGECLHGCLHTDKVEENN